MPKSPFAQKTTGGSKMIFTAEQKEKIREVKLWSFYLLDTDGKPANPLPKREYLDLRWDQIRKNLIDQLEELGYEVQFVKPSQANCIIRVFNDVKTYENDGKYRILGGNCFIKDATGKWISESSLCDLFELDYEKHELKVWFFQDEYWMVRVNFFDTYVKLKKK